MLLDILRERIEGRLFLHFLFLSLDLQRGLRAQRMSHFLCSHELLLFLLVLGDVLFLR